MKYCPSCKSIITDDAALCTLCSKETDDIAPDSTVTVCTVKGTSVSMLETSLKEIGIPCRFEKTDGDIYNEFNIKVSAESDYKVLVPFEMYGKAFDVCAGFGFVEADDRFIPESEEPTENEPVRTYDEKFEDVTGVKHRTWQTLWIILFIVAACLIIWGIDWIAELIKSLF